MLISPKATLPGTSLQTLELSNYICRLPQIHLHGPFRAGSLFSEITIEEGH